MKKQEHAIIDGMDQSHRSLPRDVFVHLLMIATLYAAVVSFLALIFQYVNVMFPDVLNTYYPSILDTIRRSEATLFIVFPVYLFLSWLIGRDIDRAPVLREFRLRKWLIYFTLFISAITIIVDLVTLIYNFLGGDLKASFVLKVIAVLVTAVAVFGYYLWDLRRGSAGSKIPRIAASVAIVIVLTSLISGFFIVGSPATQRSRRFDEERVQHLQILQSQIVNYWVLKSKLPESLGGLTDNISGFSPPTDPESGQAYEYRIDGKLSFELCAVFRLDSTESGVWNPSSREAPVFVAAYPAKPYGGPSANDNWIHSKGHVCFSRIIDPELYRTTQIPPPTP